MVSSSVFLGGWLGWRGWRKQVMGTKPAPKVGYSLGLPPGAPAGRLQSQNHPKKPLGHRAPQEAHW